MSMGITSNITGASQDVITAIKNASVKTGVDFDYLINQARTESSFNTDAKASTSSATGLYQFIDQTWLQTVSKHGSSHGLVDEANAIQKDFQGRYFVADDTMRDHIMNLRTDAEISSVMAAEFASDNQSYLESKTGREANATDLYLAHFLGAGGASQFISAMDNDPTQAAADFLPSAAKANKNIFYNSDGYPKTLEQVYNNFQAKFDDVTAVQQVENDIETTPSSSTHLVDLSYRPDVQFERMYGNTVTNYVSAFPSIDGFDSTSIFNSIFKNSFGDMVQNQVNHQSLFLTLTMLDLPT